jgi:hypothetical protein
MKERKGTDFKSVPLANSSPSIIAEAAGLHILVLSVKDGRTIEVKQHGKTVSSDQR